MLIDWFTVGAQVLNFLVLVWLLKRYLYKPILTAIDAREKRIADELADAGAKKAAAQKERDDFQARNKAFDEQRFALLAKATGDARVEHDRLIGQAHKAAEDLRVQQADALKSDQARLGDEITRVAGDEVFAIARKALGDLASASLEERMSDVFTRRLRDMDAQARQALAEALKTSSGVAVVRSSFDLPVAQREAIQKALAETFPTQVAVSFETAAQGIAGVELTAGGRKLGWSIAGYLASMQEKVDRLLDSRGDPAPAAAPAADASAKTDADADADANASVKAGAGKDAEAEAAKKAGIDADTKTDAKADTKADARTDARTNAKADTQKDVKKDARTDAAADADSEADSKAASREPAPPKPPPLPKPPSPPPVADAVAT